MSGAAGPPRISKQRLSLEPAPGYGRGRQSAASAGRIGLAKAENYGVTGALVQRGQATDHIGKAKLEIRSKSEIPEEPNCWLRAAPSDAKGAPFHARPRVRLCDALARVRHVR